MITSFIITFRESLEAALIVGIILAYLYKTHGKKYYNLVYLGIIAAVVASIISAFLFNALAGGFTGVAEEIFEGIVMIIASLLITYMILWMLKQKHIAKELEAKVDKEVHEKHKFGIFFLTFISVFREGIETVIFLSAAATSSQVGNTLVGATLGIVFAIILGYFIFAGTKKIDIKTFFNVTSVILILFAAGLFAHGVHELQEAHVVPTVVEHLFDINPAVNEDGSFPIMHENGTVGSLLKALFGYNGNPSFLEVTAYLFYLITIVLLYQNINKVHKVI